MPNNSINILLNLFTKSVSLNHHSPRGNIEDDWEYINYLDRQLGSLDLSGSGAGEEYASVNEVDYVMGDQDKPYVMKYKALSKAEARRHLEDKITKVSTVCLLPKDEAAILLQHFKWCVNNTIAEWFSSKEEAREAVGLFERPVGEIPVDTIEINCKRCGNDFSRSLVFSASCGHLVCRFCWEDYIRNAVNDGPRCLRLQCPKTSCNATVGLYLTEQLLSDADQIKFENLLLKSYIACLPEAKWCPEPDCNYAVLSYNDGEGTVTCPCLHSFCWSCSREAHAPVDCDTAAKWMSESPLQSENWVLANAITCPNCKFQYEKEFCFVYVNCPVCKHEFCSVCGDDWSNHEKPFGGLGNTSCPRNGDNTSTDFLKKTLERYNYHYEGWITCESSKANAMTDLKVFQDLQLDLLCDLFGRCSTDFNFLVEALGQAVKCWQLLKWTYVYGYYLFEDEHVKIHLLEFIQEDAKRLLRQLHEHIGKLQNFLHEDVHVVQLTDLRVKIIKMTRVIREYLRHWEVNLVAGMPEVVCIPKVSPRLKMSREQWERSGSQESQDAGPSTRRRLKISQEMEASSCSQISPTGSPSSKVMKWKGDTDISSPVGSTKSDESWDLVELNLNLNRNLNLNFIADRS